jgi:hypothetical protein
MFLIKKIMEYESLKEIVAQLEKCKFKDELGHNIENNLAFIALKEHSKCDGMSSNHDCENKSNNFLCDYCLERVYETPN